MSKRRRRSYVEVLKLAKKPSGKELWLFVKLTLIGIGLLGSIAFTIRYVFTFILPGG